MPSQKKDELSEYERRIHSELIDSFDEELEMEIDDDRMNELIIDSVLATFSAVASWHAFVSYRG